MRILFTALFLALLLPIFAARTTWADVADGVRAYDAGWYDEALEEFLPAAKGGDVQAQMALASMYQFGEGVRQDDDEAAKWTRAAAERGDAVGQINLSEFYAAGRGVARDAAESYFWLLLAAGQGNGWAEARLDAAAAGLWEASAKRARARAKNWSPVGGDLVGDAEVVDGQTLIVAGRRLRLEGITAPQPGTRCQVRGNTHNCGRISTTALMDLTAGADVTCRRRAAVAQDGSRYARCRAGGYDLSEGMVYTGWAWADGAQMTRYNALEKTARTARRGMWRRD
jgi:TPR repeat protein